MKINKVNFIAMILCSMVFICETIMFSRIEVMILFVILSVSNAWFAFENDVVQNLGEKNGKL